MKLWFSTNRSCKDRVSFKIVITRKGIYDRSDFEHKRSRMLFLVRKSAKILCADLGEGVSTNYKKIGTGPPTHPPHPHGKKNYPLNTPLLGKISGSAHEYHTLKLAVMHKSNSWNVARKYFIPKLNTHTCN